MVLCYNRSPAELRQMENTSLKRWHLVQDLNDEKNVDRQDQGEEHSKQWKGILKDPVVGKFLECARS